MDPSLVEVERELTPLIAYTDSRADLCVVGRGPFPPPGPIEPLRANFLDVLVTKQHESNRLERGALARPVDSGDTRPLSGQLRRRCQLDGELPDVLEIADLDPFERRVAEEALERAFPRRDGAARIFKGTGENL